MNSSFTQPHTVASEDNDERCQRMDTPVQSAFPALDSTNQFPWKMHQMLSKAQEEGLDHIVSWLPGKASNSFKVHNRDEFVKRIMPRFFNQTKFKSFLRQLNLWGFERIMDSGPMRGCYTNPLFVRGNPELCHQMKRTRVKSSNQKESDARMPSDDLMRRQIHHGMQVHYHERMGGVDSDTSLETIDYEKMPSNVPVAAELTNMYENDMRLINLVSLNEDRHQLMHSFHV